MSRKLAARLARIEDAMGVDPVRAALLQRDVDAELRSRIEIAESVFCNELLAACATRCVLGSEATHDGRHAVAFADAVEAHLAEVRKVSGDQGDAWTARVTRLLDRACRPDVVSADSAFGARVRMLLGQCDAELRARHAPTQQLALPGKT